MKSSILLLIFTFFSFFLSAQKKKTEEPKHEGKHYGIDNHHQWVIVKRANDQFKNRSYYNAVDNYKIVLDSLPKNEYLNYKLGMTYFEARDYANAEIYLGKIAALKTTKYPFAIFHYGETLKMNQKYDEAKAAFKKVYRIKSKDVETKKYKKFARNEYNSCNYAINLIDKDTTFYDVTFQGGDINHSYTDFSPMALGKNKLVFASLRKDTVVTYAYNDNTIHAVKLYEIERESDSTWINPKPYKNINAKYEHTANGAYNIDSTRFFFTRCRQDHNNNIICAIYHQSKDETSGEWSKPHKAHQKVNMHAYSNTQPTVGYSKKKKRRRIIENDILYFVSNRPGGVGGKDIWYSTIDSKGKFSKPVNCGKRINTLRDEVTPFYDNKNKVMYVSSNYHHGLGGFDIFKTKGREKRFRKPTNLGIPTNCSYDDTYYIPVQSTEDTLDFGYLVSNRPGGIALTSETCCDDIYSYQEYIPEYLTISGKAFEHIKTVIAKDSTMLALDSSLTVNNDSLASPIAQISDSTINKVDQNLDGVKIGFIRKRHYDKAIEENRNSISLMNEDIEWLDTTSVAGDFSGKVLKDKDYIIVAKKDGYDDQFIPISQLTASSDQNIILDKVIIDSSALIKHRENLEIEKRNSLSLELDEKDLQKDQKFVLDNVYFDTNMDELKPASLPALNLLYEFLTKNKSVKIEISGHTDSQGTEEYNQELSQRRAESVRDYILEKGVNPKRIKAMGYGETQAIAKNDNDDGTPNQEGMALNRRTEVKILASKQKK